MATIRSSDTVPLAKYDRVYDLYRNCILNEKYYGYRLLLFSRVAFWLDVVIVVGSGTSGVSGWIIWTKYPAFGALWGVIAGVATLLAALKPVLQTDAKIKRYSALFSAYRQLGLSMKIVVEDISEAGGIQKETDKEIERVRNRYRTLSVDDDPRPAPKLVAKLQDEVNQNVPPDSLFYPPSLTTTPIGNQSAADALVGDLEAVNTKVEPLVPWPGKRD